MSGFIAEAFSEDALLLRYGDSMDARINARVHAAAARLRDAGLSHVSDIAPSYASLLIRFDPGAWIGARGPEAVPHTRLLAAIESILRDDETADEPIRSRTIEIPVCYGGEFGPDLDGVAAHAKLDAREFIARHAGAEYTVAMLGFAPGFPYLLGLDVALHSPRRATPRTRVPAGSVAIGGAQTGIYPRELPGGWNVIGRTPAMLFDARRDPPCLLAPGDRVRFRVVLPDEFDSLGEAGST